MSSPPDTTIARLVLTGDSDDRVHVEGAQTAEICVIDGPLYLLVSDGTLILVQYGEDPDDGIWRLRVVLAGTATAQHRGPVLEEYSERLELTGPGLHVFAATADAQSIRRLRSGALKVCELLEPARVFRHFLEHTDPDFDWVDAWDDDYCDARSGVMPLRHVLAMRDALACSRHARPGAP